MHGYPCQSWLTFRQTLSLGGNVMKGERSTPVVYTDKFVLDGENAGAEGCGEAPNR